MHRVGSAVAVAGVADALPSSPASSLLSLELQADAVSTTVTSAATTIPDFTISHLLLTIQW
jgi:hypothetical protein